MGKAQSKRSVDITTEVIKDGVAAEENTGKLGKIEDAEQLKPQLNGDSNHKDADAPEKEIKVAKDEAENEKDNVPEKEVVPEVDNGGSGDAKPEEVSPVVVENGVAATENDVANTTTVTLDESKASDATEATEQSTDAAADKKPKKEKTKKRWSFRSFSFSKKDKQKPEKRKNADDVANDSTPAVTNGDCEKVVEETVEQAAAVAEKVADTVEAVVNGATDKVNDAETKAEAEAPSAPVAIPASDEKASAPIVEESKPAEELKEVVEQTIEQAVKSVEDKINVVSQAEENGVEKSPEDEKPAEISTKEAVNGDSVHKKIDDIVPSPEKLEKAGVQPTLTDTVAVVTAE